MRYLIKKSLNVFFLKNIIDIILWNTKKIVFLQTKFA